LLLKTAHYGVLYVSKRRRALKPRGAWGNLPPYHAILTGLPVTDVLAFRAAKPSLRLSCPDRR